MPAPNPFASLSSALTGFTLQELTETGSASVYEDWLETNFGDLFAELLELWGRIEAKSPSPAAREKALRREVLAESRFGPFARNLALLWYTAIWAELPPQWASEQAQAKVPKQVFADAYPEALCWKAAGTHPIGANPPGFGSWALAPAPVANGHLA